MVQLGSDRTCVNFRPGRYLWCLWALCYRTLERFQGLAWPLRMIALLEHRSSHKTCACQAYSMVTNCVTLRPSTTESHSWVWLAICLKSSSSVFSVFAHGGRKNNRSFVGRDNAWRWFLFFSKVLNVPDLWSVWLQGHRTLMYQPILKEVRHYVFHDGRS